MRWLGLAGLMLRVLTVGCGCEGTGGGVTLWALLGLAGRRSRKRGLP